MIQVVLADDEVLARQKLRQLLRDHQSVEIVGESATAAETIELVRATRPEVLFLDIRMPGMDGFDVIQALSEDNGFPVPRIIFTTAYDSYAIRAFEVHAADYLLKPFSAERLQSAIENACKQLQQRTPAALTSRNDGPAPMNRIVFKSRGRILFLPVSDIYWISAEENYVRICTHGETHLLRETMSRLEGKLDRQMFLRVHRSSIVNLQHVKEARSEADGESVVILSNGQRVTMSRSYRARIETYLHH